jgi:hypothetical protein
MNKLLQSYLKRLTNLSSNNRSLLLLRLISDHFIDLNEFDFINNQSSFSLIDSFIAQKPKVKLCAIADSRFEKNNEVAAKLKKIQRVDKFIYEERGSKDLYIGWPFIRGKFHDGTLIRCPLIFFPVELEVENNDWALKVRQNVPVSFNKSFLMAYAHYNEVKADETLLEFNFDDMDKDSRIFRTALYQMFKESPIELNFNQENFIDKLADFKNFKKAELDEQEKKGELKLYPEAVLGIFPQAGSYLVPDYDELIENQRFKDIEDFFASRMIEQSEDVNSTNLHFLSKVKEENTFTPYKLDAYQENAVKAVKKGNSVVIQGPPGTGKSQLICNLIADSIANGNRVLLVSQKKAALDVVYKRLQENEIADFVSLVHDFKNDRKEVYAQIRNQVDNLQEYKIKNNSLDFVSLERKFYQSSRRIDQLCEELDEYKQALFGKNECGISVKELYLSSSLAKPAANLRHEYKFFHYDNLPQFNTKLKSYVWYAALVDKADYPWKERKNFKDYSPSDFQQIIKLIEEIRKYKEFFNSKSLEIIGAEISLDEADSILEREFQILEMIELLKDPKVYEFFRHMVDYKENETDSLWLTNIERVLIDCYVGLGPEVSLPSPELGKFQMALHRRMEAKKNLFHLVRWHLLSQDKMFIKRVMEINGILPSNKGFNALVDKIDNRLNLEHNLTKLKSSPWLKDVPVSYNKVDFQTWFFFQKRALVAKMVFCALRGFSDYFNVQSLSYDEFKRKLIELIALLKDLKEQKERWLHLLTYQQVITILEDPLNAERLIKTINKDFELICEFDKICDSLQSHEASAIQKVLEVTGQVTEENREFVVDTFKNSLDIAWIEHIELKYPILRSTGSYKFKSMQKELQDCVLEKQKVSNQIVLLRLRERAYQDVEYNRLNNMVTYRDLYHQVTKKKMIWPIRKMFSYHEKEIFNLIPCWMASPESVSAIFPMEDIFDLVIFDEASQCFAEKGIPAMYRGKQIVIAGDDKQLAPNDLYRVKWEEEAEDIPELEVDSLLDLAKKHLMQVHLKGHYRSRSLDLIEFSNKNFYKGKLKLLPDFNDINLKESAIKYIKVDGIWEKNVNTIEAEKVVDLLEDLLINAPGKEIGVVTFNSRQQGHILDLLEERTLNKNLKVPDSLFIKNIENVQGDERDIIIFSIGYAPDQHGKLIMHFGSLNQINGENRLNVAVTRAKERIFVVTSIYPEQLRIDDTKNEGPKLLKDYLQYAREVSDKKYRYKNEMSDEFTNDWYLKLKLMSLLNGSKSGFSLKPEMPFADITVFNKEKYSGLIVTDDDLYYGSTSTKDAHVYTPFSFTSKNWKYLDFYSRELWQDPVAVKESIQKFVESLVNA